MRLMPKSLVALSLAACAHAALAAGDPAKGQQAFQECAACHATTQGTNGVGPSLFGVAGRKAAAVPGFAYSSALKKSDLTWTAQNLDAFIANPQQKVSGNNMPYAGMSDAQERANLVAYLQSLR